MENGVLRHYHGLPDEFAGRLHSIDEQMVGVNMDSMTKEQQDKFLASVVKMMHKSKDIAEKAVKEGRPILERIRHLIPVFSEKQLFNVGGPTQSGRTANISID